MQFFLYLALVELSGKRKLDYTKIAIFLLKVRVMINKTSLPEDFKEEVSEKIKKAVSDFYKDNEEGVLLLAQLGEKIGIECTRRIKNYGVKLNDFINENLSNDIKITKIDRLIYVVSPNEEMYNDEYLQERFHKSKNKVNYKNKNNDYNFISLMTIEELARVSVPGDIVYKIVERMKKNQRS